MAEFVIRLNNSDKERVFLSKLESNFKTINSKNILLNRDFNILKSDSKIYVLFNVTPIILNFPLYSSGIMILLWFGIKLVFGKNPYFLLIASGFFLLLSLFWTKYFFYYILKRSINKHKIDSIEMI